MPASPDYAVSPGDFLRDWLEENAASTLRFQPIRRQPGDIDSVLDGSPISGNMAATLAATTGYPVSWWMKVETQYRSDLARIGQ